MVDGINVEPRTISFKMTLQTLKAFQPVLANFESCSCESRRRIYDQLIDAVAVHRVGDRPKGLRWRRPSEQVRRAGIPFLAASEYALIMHFKTPSSGPTSPNQCLAGVTVCIQPEVRTTCFEGV